MVLHLTKCLSEILLRTTTTSTVEHRIEPDAQDDTQQQKVSLYSKEEKNEMKEPISQHFEADLIQKSRSKPEIK